MLRRVIAATLALTFSLPPLGGARSGPAEDAEIARMEALLTVSCDPAQALLTDLVAAGRNYRAAISKVERDYAREKDRQVGFLGDFALPTQAPDGLSFRFFTEFSRIRTEADQAGVLGPANIPDGLGLGPLAAAHLNPKPPANDGEKLIRAAAAKIFFDAKDEASAAKLRKTRDDFQTRFETLKEDYEARRADYGDLFGPAKLGDLNAAFQTAIRDNVDPARDVYRKLRDEVEELALSRRVEHCLGPIEGDRLASAVGGAVDPFFVKGPDNTVGGIPGMGFVLTAEPRIAPFEAQAVPAFGYKFNTKRDPVAFRDFNSDIDLIKAKASAEQIKIYALFLRDTFLELEASQAFQTGDKTREKLIGAAKGIAELGEKLLVDFGGNPVAMLGEMQIRSFDIDAETNASFTEDVGKLKKAYDAAIADMENGAKAQQALAELGFVDGPLGLSDGSINIDKIEERFAELPPEKRAEFGADIAEMLGHVEKGIERTADVQSEILAIVIEEVVSAGIARGAKELVKLNDAFKTKKAIGRIDAAADKIADARKRLPEGAEGAQELAKRQDELNALKKDANTAQEALDKAKVKADADIADALENDPAFRFGQLDGTPPKTPDLPNEPVQNIGVIIDDAGNVIELNGKKLGEGASATAFLTNDVPPKVVRTLPLEVDGVPNLNLIRDNKSLDGLIDSGLDEGAVRVIPSKPVKNASALVDGKVAQVQVAEFAPSAKGQIAKQNGKITKGQQAALAKMREELLSKGIVSTDGKLDNLSFINQGGDNWVVGIVDPGGFEKFTGPTAVADAKAFQKAFDNFADSHVADTSARQNQQFLQALFDFVDTSETAGVKVGDLFRKNTGLDLSEARFSIPSQRNPNFASQHLPPVDGTTRPPGRQPIDISEDVADFNAAKAEINKGVDDARGLVDDISAKVDAAVENVDELVEGTAANAKAAAAVEEAVAGAVVDGKRALRELAALESQRPGALASAVNAITDEARRGLIVVSRIAAEDSKEANCVRMRALLAEGDASDEVRALAAEKCGLELAEAGQ